MIIGRLLVACWGFVAIGVQAAPAWQELDSEQQAASSARCVGVYLE